MAEISAFTHAVNVDITSNLSSSQSRKRFDKKITIEDLKIRLELITGASAACMSLEVFNEQNQAVCTLTNNDALVGSYPIEDNYIIHVTDTSQKKGEFEDLSKVEKFELSQEAYDKKSDSVRSFLKKNKLGKYNAEDMAKIQKDKEEQEKLEEEKAQSIKVGDRCQSRVQGEPSRRGEVMFVGETDFKPGWWIGIKYDEPLGKNDGSIGGKQYFTVPMKYGGFCRPDHVEVGDFPEIADEDLDEI